MEESNHATIMPDSDHRVVPFGDHLIPTPLTGKHLWRGVLLPMPSITCMDYHPCAIIFTEERETQIQILNVGQRQM